MRAVLLTLTLFAGLALSGCITDDAPNAPDEPATDLPIATSFVQLPIEGHGQTEALVCLPNAGCTVREGSEDIALPDDRPVWHINGTVTWDPYDPTLPELEVFLLTVTDDGWEWEPSENTYWTGTSPLQITSHVGDETPQLYHLHARTRHQAPDPLSEVRFNTMSQGYDVALTVDLINDGNHTADEGGHEGHGH